MTEQDREELITITRRQQQLASWTTGVLIYIVVLNLFVEHWDSIVIDSFTISIFTAIVLKALLDVILGLEHRVASFFRRQSRRIYSGLGAVSTVAILFFSKFVVLEAIDIIFGDHVEIAGFVPLVVLIITMIAAERAVQWVNDLFSADRST